MIRTLVLAVTVLVLASPASAADPFDAYTAAILQKVPMADGVREIKKLTPGLALDHNNVLPDTNSAFVVLETNGHQFARLMVQGARKSLFDADKTVVPTFLIERFVTCKLGSEHAVAAAGKDLMLFDGFRFSADLGGVVPEKAGGDLRFVVSEKDGVSETYLEPVGKARLYLLTKPLAEAAPKKSARFVLATPFEPRNFSGRFKLVDDGRRSGTLTLKVNENADVTGTYISDNGGEEYEVSGKVGPVKHAVQFTIKLPRTDQTFQGLMFTGTGTVIAGTSRLADRDLAFTATRIEEE